VPTIVFIRHGETDWNAEGRFQGQQDIPLNPRGRGQARRNGRMLAETLPQSADYDFVASPLARTRETMEILRGSMGLDPEEYRLEPILKEITFGDWEGFTSAELKENWPERMVAREVDKWGFTPPAGESYAMLSERIGGWLAAVDRPTVVVSHGGVCRVLQGLLLGLGPEMTPMLDIPQDQFMIWNGRDAVWV